MNGVFKYLAFILLLVLHYLAIVYLQSNFSLPSSVFGLHFSGLAFAYWMLFLGIAFLSVLLGKSRWFKILSFIFVFASLLFFGIVYLGNAVSLKEWGEYISLDIALLFFEDAGDYMRMYGGIGSNLLKIVLFVVPAAVLSIPLSRLFASWAGAIVSFLRGYNASRFLQLALIAFIGAGSLFALYGSGLRAKMKFKGEPIYNFFVPLSSNFDRVNVDPEALAAIEAYKQSPSLPLSDAPNLVLIVVDALRADRLPMYGYPNNNAPFLQDLAEQGRLRKVPLALSNCSTSFCGILSILSGQAIQNLRTSNFKLHDVLKKRGYQTNFLLSGSHNEWYQMKRAYTYHYPIDVYFDGESNDLLDVSDDLAVLNRFEELDFDKDRPQFFYFHLMSAHRSGIRQEQFRKYKPDYPLDAFDPDSLRFNNAYDNGVLQSDDYIARIFRQLEGKGLLENSVVVITADHGEALGENQRFGHAVDINQGNLHIPFLVYGSDESEKKLPHFISQAEMMAVMLEELRIESPSFCESTETEVTYHRQGNKLALIEDRANGRYKVLTTLGTPVSELYNLSEDPLEKNNLVKSHPSVKLEMQAAVERAFASKRTQN